MEERKTRATDQVAQSSLDGFELLSSFGGDGAGAVMGVRRNTGEVPPLGRHQGYRSDQVPAAASVRMTSGGACAPTPALQKCRPDLQRCSRAPVLIANR